MTSRPKIKKEKIRYIFRIPLSTKKISGFGVSVCFFFHDKEFFSIRELDNEWTHTSKTKIIFFVS